MRGAGYAKKPAIYSLICMAINAILTPIFCFDSLKLGFAEIPIGFDMGIKGAAISTVIAYTIFSGLLFKDLFNGSQGFKLTKFTFSPDKVIFKSIFIASAIAALLPMMTNVVIYIMLRLMNDIDATMVDAFSLAKRFELYMIQLTVCLGASTMIVIGASHATQNTARVKEVLKAALKILFAVGIPITIIMAFASQFYYGSLTDKPAIIEEGGRYFIFGSLNMLFMTGLILINFCFQGLGKPALPIPFTLSSVIFIQGIGGWYLLTNNYPSTYYYTIISIGTSVTFFIILGVFYKALKK
jgi:Na+-driven multidrug efflux pump